MTPLKYVLAGASAVGMQVCHTGTFACLATVLAACRFVRQVRSIQRQLVTSDTALLAMMDIRLIGTQPM